MLFRLDYEYEIEDNYNFSTSVGMLRLLFIRDANVVATKPHHSQLVNNIKELGF